MRPRFGPFAGLSSMVGGRCLCQMLGFTMGYMLICVVRVSVVVKKREKEAETGCFPPDVGVAPPSLSGRYGCGWGERARWRGVEARAAGVRYGVDGQLMCTKV